MLLRLKVLILLRGELMADDHDDTEFTGIPESLLPYDQWMEDASREVMYRALEHVSREGLAGEHHFYLTFRTDWPGTEIPARLRAQYPHEMTIVLQHQFWDLNVDRELKQITVGLSFGGVGSILVIPFAAVSGFADPHVHLGLHFTVPEEPVAEEIEPETTDTEAASPASEEVQTGVASVVSLDAFRKKGPAQG
jgi:hypothetical protein